MFSWIIGKDANAEALPKVCFEYDTFVAAAGAEGFGELELPDVPFLMLSSLPLSPAQWKKLVEQMSWTQLRMNLNTLQRNDVFKDEAVTAYIVQRLRDPAAIRKSRVFPYQLLTTYQTVKATGELPRSIIDALHDAMEEALANVPTIEGKTAVLVDVSGSMSSNKVTGSRPGATTVTRCVDVAGLVAAALLRRNPDTKIIGFDDKAYDLNTALEPRDTVMTNAAKIAGINGGSTDCAIGIHAMFDNQIEADLIIMISDNESWVERNYGFRGFQAQQTTGLTAAWTRYKSKYPNAKMICLDIVPNSTTQAKDRVDTLNIGGFSDNVFTLISQYAKGAIGPEYWVGEVKKIELPAVE
jgi:60 kDa SS-A/Ro ribonucleoprotein